MGFFCMKLLHLQVGYSDGGWDIECVMLGLLWALQGGRGR